MKKRNVSVMLAAAAAVTVLAGCSGTGTKTETTTAAPVTESAAAAAGESKEVSGEKTKLKLALWDYDVEGSVYPAMMEAFNQKYPNIEVEVINAPANDYESLPRCWLPAMTLTYILQNPILLIRRWCRRILPST